MTVERSGVLCRYSSFPNFVFNTAGLDRASKASRLACTLVLVYRTVRGASISFTLGLLRFASLLVPVEVGTY